MLKMSLQFAMAVLLLVAAGCVQRTITITSEPTGALVHLNDDEVGRTPLTVPFLYYGVYDVRLEHGGYQPLWTNQETTAPWWEFPGPDLFAEMIPDVKVELNWHFQMETVAVDVDDQALIGRAEQLRGEIEKDSTGGD